VSGLNLGNDGLATLRELRGNPHFARFQQLFADYVYARIQDAITTPVDQRIEATAYARALRDVWIAFESGVQDKPQRQVALPRKRAATADPDPRQGDLVFGSGHDDVEKIVEGII
jgi:hypothetical protein